MGCIIRQIIPRGQVTSTDALLAAVIFLVVFILAAVLISDLFQSPIDLRLRTESQRILETVSSGVGQGSFIDGSEVDPQVIAELLSMSYSDLRALYGTEYDFCIYFEDQDGNIIMINETSAGLGDPSVNVSGLPCGIVPPEPIPEGCDIDGDTYQNTTCGGTDCNDGNSLIRPGALEVCNSLDDDCDLIVDESCVDCSDDDIDTFSDTGGLCGAIDCNDADIAIYPGATETCEDGVDQDCSGDDLAPCPPAVCTDDDSDGYYQEFSCGGGIDCCDIGNETIAGCTVGNRTTIFPGSPEICEDGIDQDCSGSDQICIIPGETSVLTCSWQVACSGVDIGSEITLFKANKTSNSHVGDASSPYLNSICCSVTNGLLGHGCGTPNGTTVVKLSGATNAHIQNTGSYAVDVCLNATGSTPSCAYRAGSTCAPDETCVTSMTAATNAMVGDCGIYTNHVCCKVT